MLRGFSYMWNQTYREKIKKIKEKKRKRKEKKNTFLPKMYYISLLVRKYETN